MNPEVKVDQYCAGIQAMLITVGVMIPVVGEAV